MSWQLRMRCHDLWYRHSCSPWAEICIECFDPWTFHFAPLSGQSSSPKLWLLWRRISKFNLIQILWDMIWFRVCSWFIVESPSKKTKQRGVCDFDAFFARVWAIWNKTDYGSSYFLCNMLARSTAVHEYCTASQSCSGGLYTLVKIQAIVAVTWQYGFHNKSCRENVSAFFLKMPCKM